MISVRDEDKIAAVTVAVALVAAGFEIVATRGTARSLEKAGVACMAVNNVFVMNAWGADQNVGDDVMMLADGNGEYAEALGLAFDGTGFGMGMRGQRFVLIVEDGTATHVAVEAPGQFEVSKAEAVLEAL